MAQEQDMFRDNIRKHVDAWRKIHGRSLLDFTDTVFPGRCCYRWVARILSEGPSQVEEGTKYHPELVRLHEFFGLESGGLWDSAQLDSLETRFRATLEGVPRTAAGDRLRQTISDQIESWRSAAQSINEDDQQRRSETTADGEPVTADDDLAALGVDDKEWTSFRLDTGEEPSS